MYIALLLIFLLWLWHCLKFLRKNEQGIVMRLGRLLNDLSTPMGPGVHWIWWPVDMLIRWSVFSGQEGLLGASGEAIGVMTDKDPFCLVRVSGKLWRATAGQEIAGGQKVRIVGYDGLNLLVEPGPELKSK